MVFISTSVSGWGGSAALQIEPFGGEDDAPESLDGDGDDGKCRKMWR